MGLIKEADVQRLMEDKQLMSDVAQAILEDPEAIDDLADDIADKLEDELEDNVELRKQIVDAALSSPDFKKKIVAKLADDLS